MAKPPVVGSLPNRNLDARVVDELEKHDRIVQAVAVRGIYEEGRDGPVAFQILLNIADRGLLGLHRNPTEIGTSWSVVFDSEDVQDADDAELYQMAHSALMDASPNLENGTGSYFEQTPPDFEGFRDRAEDPI